MMTSTENARVETAIDFSTRVRTLEDMGIEVTEIRGLDQITEDLITTPHTVVESYPSIDRALAWESIPV